MLALARPPVDRTGGARRTAESEPRRGNHVRTGMLETSTAARCTSSSVILPAQTAREARLHVVFRLGLGPRLELEIAAIGRRAAERDGPSAEGAWARPRPAATRLRPSLGIEEPQLQFLLLGDLPAFRGRRVLWARLIFLRGGRSSLKVTRCAGGPRIRSRRILERRKGPARESLL